LPSSEIVQNQSSHRKTKKNEKTKKRTQKTYDRWSKEEHILFLEAIEKYGNMWTKVKEHIKTRTCDQIRSHCQKYLESMLRRKIEETKKNNPRAVFAVYKSYRSYNTTKISNQIFPVLKPNNIKSASNFEKDYDFSKTISDTKPAQILSENLESHIEFLALNLSPTP